MDCSSDHGPSLLSLPLEVRQHIFSYLSPPARLATVLRSRHLGVSSVSHRAPPIDALLACRQLHHEMLDVYHRCCIFKIEGLLDPDNVWSLWQVEEVLQNSDLGKITLSRMRNVELNLFWHRVPDDSGMILEGTIPPHLLAGIPPSAGGFSGYKTETDKRVERLKRAVNVLSSAPELRSVHVTWKEIPTRPSEEAQDWEFKAKVLSTIGNLRGVRIHPGDVVACDETEAKVLRVLKDLDRTSWATEKKEKNKSDMEKTSQSAAVAAGDEQRRNYLDLVETPERVLSVPLESDLCKGSYFP